MNSRRFMAQRQFYITGFRTILYKKTTQFNRSQDEDNKIKFYAVFTVKKIIYLTYS